MILKSRCFLYTHIYLSPYIQLTVHRQKHAQVSQSIRVIHTDLLFLLCNTRLKPRYLGVTGRFINEKGKTKVHITSFKKDHVPRELKSFHKGLKFTEESINSTPSQESTSTSMLPSSPTILCRNRGYDTPMEDLTLQLGISSLLVFLMQNNKSIHNVRLLY